MIVLPAATGYGGGLVAGTLQQLGVPLAAFAGALLTAAAALRARPGAAASTAAAGAVGIGLGAMLAAVTSLLVNARIQDAASAQVWLNGSLNARGWEQAAGRCSTLAVLVPVAAAAGPHRSTRMQLGDDSARGLGVRLQVTQLAVLVVGVGLAASRSPRSGRSSSSRFVVPQIALRLAARLPAADARVDVSARSSSSAPTSSPGGRCPFPLPAGIVTSAIGAPYLIWLLLRTNRKVSA